MIGKLKEKLKKLKNYIRFKFVNKKAETPADINIENVEAFIQGNYRKFVHDLGLRLPPHVEEQVQGRYRVVMKVSPECLTPDEEGKVSCVKCGCKTEEKLFSDAACEKGCFPTMMNKEDWNQYKKDLN